MHSPGALLLLNFDFKGPARISFNSLFVVLKLLLGSPYVSMLEGLLQTSRLQIPPYSEECKLASSSALSSRTAHNPTAYGVHSTSFPSNVCKYEQMPPTPPYASPATKHQPVATNSEGYIETPQPTGYDTPISADKQPNLEVIHQLSPERVHSISERPSVVLEVPHREIEYSELLLDQEPIGTGGFGRVYAGFWRGARIAAKKLLVSLTPEHVAELKREASFMEYACSVNHLNPLTLLQKAV